MDALSEHRRLWSFLSVLAAIKVYLKMTTGHCHSQRRLDGKTAIITGGNSGIGKETAKDLARRGARVILACRNIPKAEAVKREIIHSTGHADVEVRSLDLSRLASVREFARTIMDTEPSLHILINNAGIPGLNGKRSIDGLELTMQINHLGHFLLTNLLLDLMRRSAPARVVFVSSRLHRAYHCARLDPDDLRLEKLVPFSNFVAYSNTKLCNVLTAAHLAKLLKDTGVTVNSLHPGVVSTDIWDKMPASLRSFMKIVIGFFMKSEKEGAQTSIYVAVSEEVDNVTGKYFVDCKIKSPSTEAQNEELARRVWEKSSELVGLTSNFAISRL